MWAWEVVVEIGRADITAWSRKGCVCGVAYWLGDMVYIECWMTGQDNGEISAWTADGEASAKACCQ